MENFDQKKEGTKNTGIHASAEVKDRQSLADGINWLHVCVIHTFSSTCFGLENILTNIIYRLRGQVNRDTYISWAKVPELVDINLCRKHIIQYHTLCTRTTIFTASGVSVENKHHIIMQVTDSHIEEDPIIQRNWLLISNIDLTPAANGI